MPKLSNVVYVNVSELRKDFDVVCSRMNVSRAKFLHSIGLNYNAFVAMRRSYIYHVNKYGEKPCEEDEFVGMANKFKYEHICKQANLNPEKYLICEKGKEKSVVSAADVDDIKNIGRVLLDIRDMLKEIVAELK